MSSISFYIRKNSEEFEVNFQYGVTINIALFQDSDFFEDVVPDDRSTEKVSKPI